MYKNLHLPAEYVAFVNKTRFNSCDIIRCVLSDSVSERTIFSRTFCRTKMDGKCCGTAYRNEKRTTRGRASSEINQFEFFLLFIYDINIYIRRKKGYFSYYYCNVARARASFGLILYVVSAKNPLFVYPLRVAREGDQSLYGPKALSIRQ